MIDPVRTQKIGGVSPAYDAPGEPNTARAASREAAAPKAAAEKPQLLDMASDVAAQGAPVDKSRVAELRAAVAEGRYGLDPRATAKAIIDFARSEKP